MTIDIGQLRADTPGCELVRHFNNAGGSLPPRQVLDAVISHLQREALQGPVEAGNAAAAALDDTYVAAAEMLNCRPEEIAIAESGSRAWSVAFSHFAVGNGRLRAGDRILTSASEWAGNYIALLDTARATGATVDLIPTGPDGTPSIDALREMVGERVRLIALTHVAANGGMVNPAAEVGAIARSAGIPFLLDAAQSVGQMKVDVEAIGCDMLTAPGRKFLRAPRGTGLIYIRQSLLEKMRPVLLDNSSGTLGDDGRIVFARDARMLETNENARALRLGLGAAIRYALGLGLDAIETRITELAGHLRRQLAGIDGIVLRDQGLRQSGIVSFTIDDMPAVEVRDRLYARQINISVGGAAYTPIDMKARGLTEILRASVHVYNTEHEIDELCRVVSETAKRRGH
jgi:cysteine desulfurase/selenocysteine lyase